MALKLKVAHLHSDRGTQFRSGDYPRFLKLNTHLLTERLGHFCGNAVCEGFFGMLTRERTNHRRYRMRDKTMADVYNYIERFHNPGMRRRVSWIDEKFSAVLESSVETA